MSADTEGDTVLEMMEKPDGDKRILIVRRADGCYSFRAQFRKDDNLTYTWPKGYLEEVGWGPPGPYLGIYDSAETAKWEALGKVDWIAATQPRN